MPAGLVGLPPDTVHRGLLVLLQALVPYLADRVGGTAESPLQPPSRTSNYWHDHSNRTSPDFASSGAYIYPVQVHVW